VLVAEARHRGRRPKILDSLIAATARALDVPVYPQDADFDEITGVKVVARVEPSATATTGIQASRPRVADSASNG
jgi:hypothetical protein